MVTHQRAINQAIGMTEGGEVDLIAEEALMTGEEGETEVAEDLGIEEVAEDSGIEEVAAAEGAVVDSEIGVGVVVSVTGVDAEALIEEDEEETAVAGAVGTEEATDIPGVGTVEVSIKGAITTGKVLKEEITILKIKKLCLINNR